MAKTATAPTIPGLEDQPQPTHSVELVTPEMAHELIGLNVRNRNLNKYLVENYANAMAAGAWNFDGAPIRISPEGVLLDGQHRLHAIIKSGTSQLFSIWRNIPEDAQNTMDTGRKRSLGDALKLRGEKDATTLGAVLALSYRWSKGVRGTLLSQGTGQIPVQIPHLLEFLDQHPEIRNGLRPASRVRGAVGRVPLSVLGTAHWIFSTLDEEKAADDAEEFFNMLHTGEGLQAGNPIHTLRNQWVRAGQSLVTVPSSYYLAIMIKAWNAWRDGEENYKLLYRPGGSKPEPFPEPH